jgi:excisionase family DNA binding protein
MALSINDACVAAGVGRNTLYTAITSGALRARKLGTKTLILTADPRLWLESLPDYSPETARPQRGKRPSVAS